jgi:ribonuclease VapC
VMVVLDTSAVTAVVFGEPDAEMFLSVMLANAGDLQMSAGTAVEVGIVVEARQGAEATKDLAILVDRLGMATVPVDRVQVEAAVAAWRRFGEGRHPAGLNLGDCFSYSLAKLSAAPLLFKGRDFAQTDIPSAL